MIALILGLAVRLHGRPLNGWTWYVFLLLTVAGSVLGLADGLRRWFVVPLLFAIHVAMPIWVAFGPSDARMYFDMRAGRRAQDVPPFLFFGKDGANTALIESYLGRREPVWRHSHYLSPNIRDGDERVDSANIIRHDGLREALGMLPDDDARRQSLLCLTNPDNKLRVHQSLLLVALEQFGYPCGLDKERWWEIHRDLFVEVADAPCAADTVVGWRRCIEDSARIRVPKDPYRLARQMRAAYYQETESWGGDYGFRDSYHDALRIRGHAFDDARNADEPVPTNIVIWDES